ncbi:hypothetical protein JCM10207_007162 [Rhodosporidiobolus poonsookiae]
MAEISPAEAERIVSHMNKDHERSLGHYLEFYARLPPSLAYAHPQITAFAGPAMVLEYGPPGARKTWTHAFRPPMGPGQARGRLVEMHKEAKGALGISDVTLTALVLPLSVILSTLVLTAFELWILLSPSPLLAHYFRWLSPLLSPLIHLSGHAVTDKSLGNAVRAFWLVGVLGVHTWEIPSQVWPAVRRWNVESWWQRRAYEILTFFGGFPVWQALNAKGRAEEAKAAKEKKAH